MSVLPRSLAATLRRAALSFPAIVVTGPRQTGKTTLLRNAFAATHRFVSLDAPDVRRSAAEDPRRFLDDHPPPVVFDEVQYVPELLSYAKERIDADRRPGRWLFTGSQQFALMKGVVESLAGRVAVFELDPLSISEQLGRGAAVREPSELLKRVFDPDGAAEFPADAVRSDDTGARLLRGGYPQLAVEPELDARTWFRSYLATYVERDVRAVLGVGDLEAFGRFVALVASRTAQTVNYASLANELGVSGPTAKSWLSVLVSTGLAYLLRPYHRNFGKRLLKAPKLYWMDTGLAAHLMGLRDVEALEAGPAYGALMETAVVAEWVKAYRAVGEAPRLWFWRSVGGDEVDLLIEDNGRLHALEIKGTATPMPRHADGLTKFAALVGEPVLSAVACRVPSPVRLRQEIRAVPWHCAW
jgi:predicted AAA+ superfamily ATPase